MYCGVVVCTSPAAEFLLCRSVFKCLQLQRFVHVTVNTFPLVRAYVLLVVQRNYLQHLSNAFAVETLLRIFRAIAVDGDGAACILHKQFMFLCASNLVENVSM